MQDYRFLNRRQYFETLISLLTTTDSADPTYIATMNVDPEEPLIAQLFEAMGHAAKRGRKVVLLLDAINFLADESHLVPGPLLLKRPLDRGGKRYKKLYDALEQLRATGGRYCILNRPSRLQLPVAGRSHIKGAVIGDTIFIGGCNLENTEHLDLMVNWESAATAKLLRDWFEQIVHFGQVRRAFGDVDIETALDDTTRLLLDAGVPGQSIIYEEALELIDNANEWLYITCQYFPGGTTARHLAAAQARGVTVEIAYSHPNVHKLQAPLQRAHILRSKLSKLPSNFFTGQLHHTIPKLHAKVLASEQSAMIGSHNYVPYGVQLGTAEIALRVNDRLFSETVHTMMTTMIADLHSDH